MHFLSSMIAALRIACFVGLAGASLIFGATAAAAESNSESAYTEKDVELDVLIEAIDEYGQWRQHEIYGDVWVPNVDTDWRPYTVGQWAYDDAAGWTWISEEPFGWVVYHYGRWSRDDELGWFWVPGTKWAPAWVAWREADEHVGWAPLPPEPPDYTGPPYESTVIYDEPRYETFWVFATYALFVRPHIHRHIIWHRHNHYHRIYHKSRRGRHAHWRHRRIVNRGVSLKELRRRARRHVRPAHAVVSDRRKASGRRHGHGGNGIVHVYRPSADAKPRRAKKQQHVKPRFHNVDDRQANQQRARTREAATSARHDARRIEKGQAGARRALKRKAATAERRTHQRGNAERRSAQQHRKAIVKPQARSKAQHNAGRKAQTHRKATAHRKVQRRASHSRKARAKPSVRRKPASRPRARANRARARPRAQGHAKSRARAARSHGPRRAKGGQRRR